MEIQNIVSWNVNSIRKRADSIQAVIDKYDPTIICLQEIKANEQQTLNVLQKYKDIYKYIYVNPTKERPGQAGTAVMTKLQPKEYYEGQFDKQGRVQVLHFEGFVLYNMYVYFVQLDSNRFDIKKQFLDDLKSNILEKGEIDIIVTGDMNTSFKFKDIKSRLSREQIITLPGFTRQERNAMKQLMNETNLIDVFRHFQPNERKYSSRCYSDPSFQQRLDMFLINKEMIQRQIKYCDVTNMYLMSDHSVIVLQFKQQQNKEVDEIEERLQQIAL